MNRFIFTILITLFLFNFSDAFNCPDKTKAGFDFIYFVGKLDGLGGDKEVEVWFEYGIRKDKLDKQTKKLVLTNAQIFCLRELKFKPCTTYYYRAVAKNSVGINYGITKEIKTLCRRSNSSDLNSIKNEINNKKSRWIIF